MEPIHLHFIIFIFATLTTNSAILAKNGLRSRTRARTRALSNELEDPLEQLNESEITRPGTRIDPQGSWLSFVRHSENEKKKPNPKKKKKKIFKGMQGPVGPPGPAGPAGPPGTAIAKEFLLKEFRDLVQSESERRTLALLAERKYSNDSKAVRDEVTLGDLYRVPRITAGFHYSLKSNMIVQERTFLELKNYFMPFGGGSFQRGGVFDPLEGRFTAPKAGIYQFAVHIQVLNQGYRNGKPRRLRRRDSVRVLVCIQSLCQKYSALQYISGLESNSRIFTVSVSGLLQLELNQYTSVYIDNSSSKPVTILGGSDFSGVLIGN